VLLPTDLSIIAATKSQQLRTVSRVVPHESLIPVAMEVAESIASNPPLAVQALKRGVRRALDPDRNHLGRWVSETLSDLFATEDHREGVRSFLEKREPNFIGR
jgi:enoyl-CoA hydratase/carnithine racemase